MSSQCCLQDMGKAFVMVAAFDEIYKPAQPSIVCVISPLTAIIEDQVCILYYQSLNN